MITLPDRFEFLSDAWLEEARRFLEKAVEQRKAALAAPFSLSASGSTDAPPHLELPDNVGAWTARYDGEAISVARGFDPTADVAVEGDYQAGAGRRPVHRHAGAGRDEGHAPRGRRHARQGRACA